MMDYRQQCNELLREVHASDTYGSATEARKQEIDGFVMALMIYGSLQQKIIDSVNSGSLGDYLNNLENRLIEMFS